MKLSLSCLSGVGVNVIKFARTRLPRKKKKLQKTASRFFSHKVLGYYQRDIQSKGTEKRASVNKIT